MPAHCALSPRSPRARSRQPLEVLPGPQTQCPCLAPEPSPLIPSNTAGAQTAGAQLSHPRRALCLLLSPLSHRKNGHNTRLFPE